MLESDNKQDRQIEVEPVARAVFRFRLVCCLGIPQLTTYAWPFFALYIITGCSKDNAERNQHHRKHFLENIVLGTFQFNPLRAWQLLKDSSTLHYRNNMPMVAEHSNNRRTLGIDLQLFVRGQHHGINQIRGGDASEIRFSVIRDTST